MKKMAALVNRGGSMSHVLLPTPTRRAYRMGMPTLHTDWTAAQAMALPDSDNRYEVLDGELIVMPPPSWAHQVAVEQLYLLLHPYVRDHALGWAKLSPSAVMLSEHRLVQPDVFVLPRGDGAAPRDWSDISALLLAVEVLSPSTARRDRSQKRHMYQAFGASEYWIVDTNARLVEQWLPNDERPELCSDTLPWAPAGSRAPLIIDLVNLFAVVAGERD